jgi:hypothetical protein
MEPLHSLRDDAVMGRRCVSDPCSGRPVTLCGQDLSWDPEIIPTVVRPTRGVLVCHSTLSPFVVGRLHDFSPIQREISADNRFRSRLRTDPAAATDPDRRSGPIGSRARGSTVPPSRGALGPAAGVPPGKVEGGRSPSGPPKVGRRTQS